MARSAQRRSYAAAVGDDERALLELHEVDRRAHLTGDAELMGTLFGEEIHEASGGEIRRLTGAELEARFRDAWSTIRYLEWSDPVPPLVGVSGDTAWMLARVHARRQLVTGEALPDFDAAWLGVYERSSDGWKLRAVSSSVVMADEGG
jgi:hypothetical protein